jgi:hypothetical protein
VELVVGSGPGDAPDEDLVGRVHGRRQLYRRGRRVLRRERARRGRGHGRRFLANHLLFAARDRPLHLYRPTINNNLLAGRNILGNLRTHERDEPEPTRLLRVSVLRRVQVRSHFAEGARALERAGARSGISLETPTSFHSKAHGSTFMMTQSAISPNFSK